MTPWRTLVRGLGAGMVAAYFFDPTLGARRRALVRARLGAWARDAVVELDADVADVRKRVRRTIRTLRRLARGEAAPRDDGAIAERLRIQLHRLEHPGTVAFDVHDGCVHLRGTVLPRDAERARRAVRQVRGARELVDELDVHATPDVPELQSPRRGLEPATRLAVGLLTTAALAPVARYAGAGRVMRVGGLATLAGAVASVERSGDGAG